MKIVDILFHIHPDLSIDERMQIEDAVGSTNGVMSVHFSEKHPHELSVSYDPDAIKSEAILEQIREWDENAVMAGL